VISYNSLHNVAIPLLWAQRLQSSIRLASQLRAKGKQLFTMFTLRASLETLSSSLLSIHSRFMKPKLSTSLSLRCNQGVIATRLSRRTAVAYCALPASFDVFFPFLSGFAELSFGPLLLVEFLPEKQRQKQRTKHYIFAATFQLVSRWLRSDWRGKLSRRALLVLNKRNQTAYLFTYSVCCMTGKWCCV
jgi:hypothetical protein